MTNSEIMKRVNQLINQPAGTILQAVWLVLKNGGAVHKIVTGTQIDGSMTYVWVMNPSTGAKELVPLESIASISDSPPGA